MRRIYFENTSSFCGPRTGLLNSNSIPEHYEMSHPVVEIASDMTPILAKHRKDAEASRCLAGPVVDRLRAEGLARMSLASAYGGLEVPPVDALKAYECLAAADPSVPWILWNCALVTYFSRFMRPELRDEVFSNPEWFFAQSTRPMGIATEEGGDYIVSGRWSLVSGCELAEWFFLTCNESEHGDNDTPKSLFVCVPKQDCRILDTWHTGGLRSTGSHDVELREVRVPLHRTFDMSEVYEIDSPFGRTPINCMLQAIFAAQTIGLAQCALDTLIESGKTLITSSPQPDLRDRAAAQSAVARHTHSLGAARNYLYLQVQSLWDQVVGGDMPGNAEISAVYGASMHTIDASKQTVNEICELGGTRSLYSDSPLERIRRDLPAMLQHIIAQPMWHEDTGRVIFGMRPLIPIYEM